MVSTAASVSDTVLASNGRQAHEHLVQHDAKGPDVGALIHGLAAGLLGRHVGGCAEDDAGKRSAAGKRRRHSPGSDCRKQGPRTLASPKSSTFTDPSGLILMLPGLRSRCTMPLSWAASSAPRSDGRSAAPFQAAAGLSGSRPRSTPSPDSSGRRRRACRYSGD